jgi:hypothetical protein
VAATVTTSSRRVPRETDADSAFRDECVTDSYR